ncbi:MAG: hypothetical protein RLN74_11380, partial [Ilumatobacter fluminis]
MRRGAAIGMLVAAGVSASVVAAVTVIDEPAVVDTVARRVRSAVPTVGGCDVFPADNAWNRDVSADPLRADSDAIIATIQSNGGTRLHPDFGENPNYGIPFVVVPPDQPLVPVDYVA